MKIIVLLSMLIGSSAWAKWTVSSYNIRNFDKDYEAGPTNTEELGKIIKEFKSDVMGFVEVVNLPAFEKLVAKNLPGYMIQNSKCGGGGKQKLAVVFNPKVFEFISTAEDMSFSDTTGKCGSLRPVLLVTLEHIATKKLYTFAAVHLKAGGDSSAMGRRWEQYENLTGLAGRNRNTTLIMLGDFNTTGYSPKDQDFDRFQDFLTSSGYKTVSENFSCTSYWSGTLGNGQHEPSVLDHIVMKQSQFTQVQDFKLGSHCAKIGCKAATPVELGVTYEHVSDHCPIQVTFK